MKAAVVHGPNDLRVEQVPDPIPLAHEVLVRVHAVGVCGSDIPRVLDSKAHYYPIILGHEFAGVVAAVGEAVDDAWIGERVTAAPLVPCRTCNDCQSGNYSLCRQYTFIGSREPGAFAELVRVPVDNLVKLESTVTLIQGALFEPSTVALHGLRVANFAPGRDVVVLGAGTVGIFAMQWAKLLGARSVTAVDVNPSRLELARRLGADSSILAGSASLADEVAQATEGRGFGVVVETAGQNATVTMGLRVAAPKASMALIGNSSRDLTFAHADFELINRKELVITGSWMSYSAPFPGPEWEMTAAYFASGRLKIDPEFLHGVYELDRAGEAFAEFAEPGRVSGKVMLAPAGLTSAQL